MNFDTNTILDIIISPIGATLFLIVIKLIFTTKRNSKNITILQLEIDNLTTRINDLEINQKK